jgi:hypothetical protein
MRDRGNVAPHQPIPVHVLGSVLRGRKARQGTSAAAVIGRTSRAQLLILIDLEILQPPILTPRLEIGVAASLVFSCGAGLLLPSLNVHAHHDKPQGQ